MPCKIYNMLKDTIESDIFNLVDGRSTSGEEGQLYGGRIIVEENVGRDELRMIFRQP
jgi:hypothetical protein